MKLATAMELYAQHKLHYKTQFRGLPISIENRKGSIRRGVHDDGTPWQTKFTLPYGYINLTEGTDGDHVDAFLGPNESTENVYIAYTKNPLTQAFDEHKVFLGLDSEDAANQAFSENYDSMDHLQHFETMPFDEFKTLVMNTRANPGMLASSLTHFALHIDSYPSFHPSSLKNPQHVPVDSPGETDDRFLDVTRRNKFPSFRERLTQMTKGGPMPVGRTAVQHHTGGATPYYIRS